jgi:hypothetical protein
MTAEIAQMNKVAPNRRPVHLRNAQRINSSVRTQDVASRAAGVATGTMTAEIARMSKDATLRLQRRRLKLRVVNRANIDATPDAAYGHSFVAMGTKTVTMDPMKLTARQLLVRQRLRP